MCNDAYVRVCADDMCICMCMCMYVHVYAILMCMCVRVRSCSCFPLCLQTKSRTIVSDHSVASSRSAAPDTKNYAANVTMTIEQRDSSKLKEVSTAHATTEDGACECR